MTEQVHVLVIGTDDCIDQVGGVYAHEERVEQAVEVIEARSLVESNRWVDYLTFPVNCATPI